MSNYTEIKPIPVSHYWRLFLLAAVICFIPAIILESILNSHNIYNVGFCWSLSTSGSFFITTFVFVVCIIRHTTQMISLKKMLPIYILCALFLLPITFHFFADYIEYQPDTAKHCFAYGCNNPGVYTNHRFNMGMNDYCMEHIAKIEYNATYKSMHIVVLIMHLFIGFLLGGVVASFISNYNAQIGFAELANSGCISIGKGNSVTVIKRTPELAKSIEIREYTYRQKYHEEAELVYTGATVGGVHMGGFHVNPESQENGQFVKSGKYDLILVPYNLCISQLILTDELVEEAKKDTIMKFFLKDNILFLEYDASVEEEVSQHLLSTAENLKEKTIAENYFRTSLANKKLSLAHCQHIRNWLGGQ